jgi:hypothetical protein
MKICLPCVNKFRSIFNTHLQVFVAPNPLLLRLHSLRTWKRIISISNEMEIEKLIN